MIYPHPPQNRRSEAKVFLKDLVGKHQVGVVAIGNGTACRETEELIAEIIAEGTFFSQNPEAAARHRRRPRQAKPARIARARGVKRQPSASPVAGRRGILPGPDGRAAESPVAGGAPSRIESAPEFLRIGKPGPTQHERWHSPATDARRQPIRMLRRADHPPAAETPH